MAAKRPTDCVIDRTISLLNALLKGVSPERSGYRTAQQAISCTKRQSATRKLFMQVADSNSMAEMRANRTHPRRSARPTTALKAAGPTRAHPSPLHMVPSKRRDAAQQISKDSHAHKQLTRDPNAKTLHTRQMKAPYGEILSLNQE